MLSDFSAHCSAGDHYAIRETQVVHQPNGYLRMAGEGERASRPNSLLLEAPPPEREPLHFDVQLVGAPPEVEQLVNNIKQVAEDFLYHWKTFPIGKNVSWNLWSYCYAMCMYSNRNKYLYTLSHTLTIYVMCGLRKCHCPKS